MAIEYKELRHYQTAQRLEVEWLSDSIVNVCLIADDRRATVATISATTLALWREDISRALDERPNPNPDR